MPAGEQIRKTSTAPLLKVAMPQEVFHRLSDFIYTQCGIRMTAAKKTMLEARLVKRMRAVGLTSFGEYCKYLFSPEGRTNELAHMIDAVTTNKTDFFREPQHFDFLVDRTLPELIRTSGAGIRRPLMTWSAACSSGEEPYTIAMVLEEFSRNHRGFHYLVLGTDISTRVLDKAKEAIYDEERIIPVAMDLRKRYLMKSKDPKRSEVRIAPELRSKVKFRRLNFMDDDFGLREKMDVIFCRNVLIYFDRSTQEMVLRRLCDHLVPGGFLFTGHSETISGMDLPLKPVANTVSRRT
ncbi:MAG TPA: protein-glutamate O-methyltransferase [Deltaproteobacteria bacterium]|nr:protein-glutamate O-methyltransferase [Deltaproteobacteria bacterium]HXK47024.1 protein-glutamate O-methyltransferase [Deltaproteobacteria bacterium]